MGRDNLNDFLMLDLSKAFVLIDHDLLLKKTGNLRPRWDNVRLVQLVFKDEDVSCMC